GGLVSRADLMDKVWAGCCVEDSNVSQTISVLRRVLEDKNGDGTRRCISTVWGRGYRIIADVKPVAVSDVTGLARSHGAGSMRVDSRKEMGKTMDPGILINRLTPTERRVLEMIADSRMSRQIAAEPGISVRTVENHRAKIRAKLGISGPYGLLRFALEQR